jgi:ubiquinone/menaquinone biosynthesis C-methylase UbiE
MVKEKAELKLDLGCGIFKQEGFIGVDIEEFPGVDKVVDLSKKWPWKNNSVDEIYCGQVLEHFDAKGRAHIVNEMFRVLKKGAKATIKCPYGLSDRAYGDPTHQWPPVTGFWFYYLSKSWRDEQAPHCNKIYTCDFDATWGYALNPSLGSRSQETQQFAVEWYVNSIMEIHATLIKR